MKDDCVTLIYEEGDIRFVVGMMLTNHSISIDEMITLLDVNMDEFANAHGWDSWDYGALRLVYEYVVPSNTYQIWHINGQQFLIKETDIIRGVYNAEGAIVTNLTPEEWLALSQEERKEEGKIPEYIFSDENQTIILGDRVYENYNKFSEDVYEDYACAKVKGWVVWRADDYDEVEILGSLIRMTDIGRMSQHFAGRTTKAEVMVATYSNHSNVLDSAVLMTHAEFDDYCNENAWTNPFYISTTPHVS